MKIMMIVISMIVILIGAFVLYLNKDDMESHLEDFVGMAGLVVGTISLISFIFII